MRRAWTCTADHYLVLPLGAAIAIVWANTYSASYFHVAQACAFAVNGVGMAFVLAYLMQEVIEAALPGGSLYSWRRTAVPIVAALGGTIGAIGAYLACIGAGDEDILVQGWPVVCAVDVVVSLAVARAIFRRGAAAHFLLVVAIVSDIVGLAVISNRALGLRGHPAAALLIVIAIGLAALLRRADRRSVWPYLLGPGVMSWFGCFWAGVHPALALMPVVPFLPHSARDLTNATNAQRVRHDQASHFESLFEWPVQVVVALFGFTNGGVLIRGFGTGTWAVLIASLAGRPLAMVTVIAVAIIAGLELPRAITWKDVVVIALATSPGLTFGVLFATAVFPDGPLLMETKMGAIASVAGVAVALAAARLLRVGRFVEVGDQSERALRRRPV